MDVVLLGSGNVATHLAKAIKSAGHQIVQVYSRSINNAQILAKQVNARHTNDLRNIADADIFIISVSDDAIPQIVSQLNLQNKLTLHTSGSTDIAILNPVSKSIGVLYPLQSFSKQRTIDFKTIPIAVEGNSDKTTSEIEKFAFGLSRNVFRLNFAKRLALHVAAVFACNFTNHLYTLAEKILSKESLDFELLKPLIKETADRIKQYHPEDVQTGPAVRKDILTLSKHKEYLNDNAELNNLYTLLSQSIINLHYDN